MNNNFKKIINLFRLSVAKITFGITIKKPIANSASRYADQAAGNMENVSNTTLASVNHHTC